MKTRIETDSIGEVQVPEEFYWGAQTARSLENFKIGSQRFTRSLIWAMGQVKKACANVNSDLEKLTKEKANLRFLFCSKEPGFYFIIQRT